jgi:PAS domain S-box-containing protein
MSKNSFNKEELLGRTKNELVNIILQLKKDALAIEQRNTELEDEIDRCQEAESKFHLLFEMSDDAILVIEKGKFVDCNKAVVKMLGYENKEQFLNTHPSELSPKRQPDGKLSHQKAEEMMRLARKNGSHHFEWIHTKLNGEDFPVEVWLSATKFKGKYLINTIWRDLSERKRTEIELNKNFREREVLLQEIHHRVKNNLQIIISLLRLQKSKINSDEIQYHFTEVINRIMVISSVHQKLYQEKVLARINLKSYLVELSEEIKHSSKPFEKFEFQIDTDVVDVGLKTIVPFGLLVNELIYNSLKHSFASQKSPNISISLIAENSSSFIFKYLDNGNSTLVNNSPQDFGIELIEILVQQLEGTLQKTIGKTGSNYLINIKNLDKL